MTPDQITSLAKQASDVELNPNPAFDDFLQRFAELVRNEVLEEAVKQRAIPPKKPQGYYMSMSPMRAAKEDAFGAGFRAGGKALRDAILRMKK